MLCFKGWEDYNASGVGIEYIGASMVWVENMSPERIMLRVGAWRALVTWFWGLENYRISVKAAPGASLLWVPGAERSCHEGMKLLCLSCSSCGRDGGGRQRLGSQVGRSSLQTSTVVQGGLFGDTESGRWKNTYWKELPERRLGHIYLKF